MQLHGRQMIGFALSSESSAMFQAHHAATRQPLAPAFHEASIAEVDRALSLADAAFDSLRHTRLDDRAELLQAIARRIGELGDALIERAGAETGYPPARLLGERARTIAQTQMFAAMVREGSWLDARIDHPQPDRQPAPKPDVRRILMPIGPVAVFGAANFPLAISVAGTDTVTALAAGCPVVVKAHPAHPGTCELLAGAVLGALRDTGLPEGAFSLLQGIGHEVGLSLVRHPATRAVAFTGSLAGGRALFQAACQRPVPIPFYGELGSVNPVFLLPGALAERADKIAEGYVQSVTMGVGQFCTNPGVVFGVRSGDLDRFTDAAARSAAAFAPASMLHAGIHAAFQQGVRKLAATPGVRQAGRSAAAEQADLCQAPCVIYTADIATFKQQAHLHQEIFGPTSIVVRCDQRDDLLRAAESMEGSLTATIHGTEKDLLDHADLLAVLERKVGRLIFNGFPTGIEVCHAMHHGGPYPATTDPHWTSIGSASILRFVRPICYQNFPETALPEPLKNFNSREMWRLIDGAWTRDNA
jgi:NADP-dependent aldehyde dehydrogenase